MVQVQLIIWDSPWEIKKTPPTFFKSANGIVIVFDLTRSDTLVNLPNNVKYIIEHTDMAPSIILVGNKEDLEDERIVDETEVFEICNILQQYDDNIPYIETSAKTGENVERVFEELSRKMLAKQMATSQGTPGEDEKSFIFKVLVVGDLGVGCTSLIQRSTVGRFAESYKAVLGTDFAMKTLELEEFRREDLFFSVLPTAPTPAPQPYEDSAIPAAGAPAITPPPSPIPKKEDKAVPAVTRSIDMEKREADVSVRRREKMKKEVIPEPEELSEAEPAAAEEEELPAEEEAATEEEFDDVKREPAAPPPSRLSRETAVSYYDRMNPFQNFPLRVMISKKPIDLEPLKEIRHVEGILEVEREEKELPIVQVVPVFPGCIVTPQESAVNIDEEQTVFFYVTPLVLGEVEGRIEFWYKGKKVAVSETPTTVEKQTIAKIFATVGTVVGVIPTALDFMGFDLNEMIRNQLKTNRPALERFITSLGGLAVVQILIFIMCVLIGGYFYRLARPHEVEQQQTIAYT